MFNIDNITQYNACSDIESKNISYNLFGFLKNTLSIHRFMGWFWCFISHVFHTLFHIHVLFFNNWAFPSRCCFAFIEGFQNPNYGEFQRAFIIKDLHYWENKFIYFLTPDFFFCKWCAFRPWKKRLFIADLSFVFWFIACIKIWIRDCHGFLMTAQRGDSRM